MRLIFCGEHLGSTSLVCYSSSSFFGRTLIFLVNSSRFQTHNNSVAPAFMGCSTFLLQIEATPQGLLESTLVPYISCFGFSLASNYGGWGLAFHKNLPKRLKKCNPRLSAFRVHYPHLSLKKMWAATSISGLPASLRQATSLYHQRYTIKRSGLVASNFSGQPWGQW